MTKNNQVGGPNTKDHERRKRAIQIIELIIDGVSPASTFKNILNNLREYAAREYREEVARLREDKDKLISVNEVLAKQLSAALSRIEHLEDSAKIKLPDSDVVIQKTK